MPRLTITKDPGYPSSANVDGRALTGDVSLSGDTLKVGGEEFKVGSMRIIMETAVEQPATPLPPADHPAMAGRESGEAAAPAAAPGTGTVAGVPVSGAGAGTMPAADGGNAPSTRSSR